MGIKEKQIFKPNKLMLLSINKHRAEDRIEVSYREPVGPEAKGSGEPSGPVGGPDAKGSGEPAGPEVKGPAPSGPVGGPEEKGSEEPGRPPRGLNASPC